MDDLFLHDAKIFYASVFPMLGKVEFVIGQVEAEGYGRDYLERIIITGVENFDFLSNTDLSILMDDGGNLYGGQFSRDTNGVTANFDGPNYWSVTIKGKDIIIDKKYIDDNTFENYLSNADLSKNWPSSIPLQ